MYLCPLIVRARPTAAGIAAAEAAAGVEAAATTAGIEAAARRSGVESAAATRGLHFGQVKHVERVEGRRVDVAGPITGGRVAGGGRVFDLLQTGGDIREQVVNEQPVDGQLTAGV